MGAVLLVLCTCIMLIFFFSLLYFVRTRLQAKQQPTVPAIVNAVMAVKKEDAAKATATATATGPAKATGTGATTPKATGATDAPKTTTADFLGEHKAVLIAVPVQVAATLAAKAAAKAITGRAEQSIAKYTVKVAARALEKMGVNVGQKLLVRLGVRAATTAGTMIGSQAAVAAAAGPGAPFVEAAMLCFDVLSLGLDAGDAGGYNKMGTKKMYMDMKAGVDKAFQKAFADQGVPFPIISGPLDSLNAADLKTALTKKTTDVLGTPGNKYLKPMQAALAVWMAAHPTAQEADIDAWSTSYLNSNPIDVDALTADALAQLCVGKGGVVVGNSCGWPTKDACLGSYSWPLKPNDIYSEWVDGKCQLASQGLRGICEQNNLKYNQDTHLCDVTETYCKSKGAEWTMNSKINQMDCSIPMGQSVAEALFGTTIVRGLKQIFDMDQYEKCKPGETDDGYFCRSTGCPDGQQMDAGLCYPKCRDGFSGIGPVCWGKCNPGFTDDGATCRRAGYCPIDQAHDGGLCYPKCKDGFYGVGPMCWGSCPAGFPDGPTFCSKPGSYGRGAGYVIWDGDKCKREHAEGCEKNGALWYPKCKAGFHSVGCCVCSPNCPPGFSDTGATCEKPRYGRGGGTPDTTITAKDSYGRGVGAPGVHIRPKARIVPYSTKNN